MLRAAILAVLLAPRLAFAGCETILATDSSKVAKTGDTMTGALSFTGASSYVTLVSSLNAQGIWGTFTGDLTGDVTGNCSGNAGTATALAANGSNCAAGLFPLGVGADGAVESCTDAATQAELDTHTTATDAHSATSANTASRIVLRDASGNFAAGTITANLTGNASGTAGSLAANGANCAAGSYPLGVDASGAVESCTSASAGEVPVPTRQTFLSGSGTYTTPASARQLRIRMIGGGGGGAAGQAGGAAGSNGGASSFWTVVASSGIGGTVYTGGAGAAGGTGGAGTATLRLPGGPGGSAATTGGTITAYTGQGGSSALGGGAPAPTASAVGTAALANTGGGGSSGNESGYGGGGGSGGEYVELIINTPSATYLYTVGAGGAGGAGTRTGGAGGSGIVIVDEFY